jgi:hypothetical protein
LKKNQRKKEKEMERMGEKKKKVGKNEKEGERWRDYE